MLKVRLFRSLVMAFAQLGMVIGLFGFAQPSRADVWETRQAWDARSEDAFSVWVRNVRMDIFTSGTYSGISTDCADAVYILRIIYAYENGLPVAFANKELSNTNKSFDSVDAGLPRLLKFLRFVRSNVNTRSLIEDTYPLAINRKHVRAGAMFVHPLSVDRAVPLTYRAGHVYYIQDVFENGMIRYFSSTVPSMVRDLQPRIDISFAPFTKEGGYRSWKRPGSGERPGLSEEQFGLAGWRKNAYRDPDLWENWSREIRRRLGLRAPTAAEELSAGVENVKGYIKERVNLVNRGWAVYRSKYRSAKCFAADDYDDYSTPTRDVKIQTELQLVRDAAIRYLHSQGSSGSESELNDLYSKYRFQVLPGISVDLNDLWNTFHTEVVLSISEPEHSPEVRWGLKEQGRWPCPQRAKQYVGGERLGQ